MTAIDLVELGEESGSCASDMESRANSSASSRRFLKLGVGLGMVLLIGAAVVLTQGAVQHPERSPQDEAIQAFLEHARGKVQAPEIMPQDEFLEAFNAAAALSEPSPSEPRVLFSKFGWHHKCVKRITKSKPHDKKFEKAMSGLCYCAADTATSKYEAHDNIHDIQVCADKADDAGKWHKHQFMTCLMHVCPALVKHAS
jgi:hypothetical protein